MKASKKLLMWPQVTMFAWTAYMSTVGTLLLLSPLWLFTWLGFRDPGEGMWVRLCGMFFLILAYYCFRAARTNNRVFMQWTVTTRTWPILFVTAFAILNLENLQIITFGVIDLIAAYWTHRALRDSSQASRATERATTYEESSRGTGDSSTEPNALVLER